MSPGFSRAWTGLVSAARLRPGRCGAWNRPGSVRSAARTCRPRDPGAGRGNRRTARVVEAALRRSRAFVGRKHQGVGRGRRYQGRQLPGQPAHRRLDNSWKGRRRSTAPGGTCPGWKAPPGFPPPPFWGNQSVPGLARAPPPFPTRVNARRRDLPVRAGLAGVLLAAAADAASNPANWQGVAGSGADASPYFRIFNPVTQSK